MLFGIVSILAGLGASADDPRPIRLEAHADNGGIELHVIGETERQVAARYALEVANGAGNRSRQSGQARLVPGTAVLLLRVRLSNSTSQEWEARLVVEPGEGASYEVIKTSAEIGE